MQGMVVPRDKFPVRRKTACCGNYTRKGESVLVVPYRKHGTLVGNVILHRRCLVNIIDNLPYDAEDYNSRFKAIREAAKDQGTAFPDLRKRRRKGADGR